MHIHKATPPPPAHRYFPFPCNNYGVQFNFLVGKGARLIDDCIKVNVPCFSTSALEFFTVICILYVNVHQKNIENNPGGPKYNLYQIMYALTSFREWSVPDSGSPHTI